MKTLALTNETANTVDSKELFAHITYRYAAIGLALPKALTHSTLCKYIAQYKPPKWAVQPTSHGLMLDYIACNLIVATLDPQVVAVISVNYLHLS